MLRRVSGAYLVKGIEIPNAVGINRLHDHQFSAHGALASIEDPPSGGESHIRLSEVTLRDPVALRKNSTPGRNYFESVKTAATYCIIVNGRVQDLEP